MTVLHVAGSRPRPCTCGCSCKPVTPQELRLLMYVAHGWTNARIAKTVAAPASTVSDRVQALMRKVGATDRTTLVVCAFRDRLLGFDRDGRIVVAEQAKAAA